MCSETKTAPSIGPSSAELDRLRGLLDAAEAVVVGAGAGLSTSAGLVYGGPRFQNHFADFIGRYHYQDMYTAGFYPYATPEEYWAYWSRHILLNRYGPAPDRAYPDLLRLLAGTDYFVLTTNVDYCFQKSGFDKARLFYTQGDYGLFQCAKPCCQRTYDNEALVRRMAAEQREMRIPTDLLPRCPVCGGPMTQNLRRDDAFVQDEGWDRAAARYTDFLRRVRGKRVLFLELGVGWNTPGIIKYPFWKWTRTWPDASYAAVNLGQSLAPRELGDRALCIDGDAARVLSAL